MEQKSQSEISKVVKKRNEAPDVIAHRVGRKRVLGPRGPGVAGKVVKK